MNFTKGKLFILIGGIITGFFITNNIGKTAKITSNFLSSQEYQDAIEERNKLLREIENIREENIEYRFKISKYKGNSPEKTQKIIEDMKKQLADYGRLSGINAVTGPGVVLTIQDGEFNKILDTQADIWRKIFHEDDMALVLNEIRNTSAEAIAINDRRILPNTGVSCSWAFIGFEDDAKEHPPFYIYIIGNPDELMTSLLAEDSYIQKLILREIKVEIEKREEIVIPATFQNTIAKYMEIYGEAFENKK
ncbi:DUF881 domain-containing protein [Caproiciproducens sp. MSJ-32]|uniref:DUF881 domain-containing protein n=1 Tax=Caproiciproducens sp. MSJ-32 TaxID=2841527 RepID=UPI001C1228B3|nr:DUF881 domain-containing protein [Caproiciproducens sp. MSJ-32]MBU5454605.1 DUF881 domain-containing protein [Caproiciproducens sp. MSJ-32]